MTIAIKREYKIAKGWAIFMYLGAPLLIALFAWILLMPILPGANNDMPMAVYWFLGPISFAMIGVMVMGVWDAKVGRFVIEEDRICSISPLKRRELLFGEIKGFRIIEHYVIVESNTPAKKRIKISTYLGKANEIVEWLSAYYPDLDVLQAEQEVQQILADDTLGWAVEQREAKLRSALLKAKYFNWAGYLAGAWALFYPNPYEFAMLAAILVPVAGVLLLRTSEGLIRIDEKKGSAYPTILWGVSMPCMAVMLRAILDLSIYSYSLLWVPSALMAFTLIVAILIGNKEFNLRKLRDWGTIAGLSICMYGYAFGTIIILNCIYDNSQPEVFTSEVLSKRVSTGKTTTYYLELTPWGPQEEADEVKVSKDLYQTVDEEDEVYVYFMKGRFGIPWFEVLD